MKTNPPILGVLTMLALLLNGCATTPPALTLAPVGPPAHPSVPIADGGTLVVYSAYETGQIDTDPPDGVRQHSAYRLYDAQGRLLRTVPNRVGAWGEDPTRVGLMPGRYRIEALANSYGLVSVPVVIVANEVTTVHLEGSPEWPASPAFNAINSVRLPDGVVVGWKAEAGAMGGP